jgi:hypothetical protein
VLYTNIAGQTLGSCRTRCQLYTTAGRTCRVYGLNQAANLCTLSLGSTAPTFEQAFTPNPNAAINWYAVECSV